MITFDESKIAQLLKDEMREKSVRTVADAIGINPTRLWRLSKEIYPPSVNEFTLICEYFMVNPSEFFTVRMFTIRGK